MHSFHPSILREYDIRGVIGETLSALDAYAIGRAFGSFKPEWKSQPPKIAVCRDGRASSPALEEALVRGLTESGANVIRLGVGPTPMLYFAVCSLMLDGGVMITGSHNPPTHNGFKFMLGTYASDVSALHRVAQHGGGDAVYTPHRRHRAFYGADIQQLGKIAAHGAYHNGHGIITEKISSPNIVQFCSRPSQVSAR
jgi:phosphomannomutase